jgi:hypothetical protein
MRGFAIFLDVIKERYGVSDEQIEDKSERNAAALIKAGVIKRG